MSVVSDVCDVSVVSDVVDVRGAHRRGGRSAGVARYVLTGAGGGPARSRRPRAPTAVGALGGMPHGVTPVPDRPRRARTRATTRPVSCAATARGASRRRSPRLAGRLVGLPHVEFGHPVPRGLRRRHETANCPPVNRTCGSSRRGAAIETGASPSPTPRVSRPAMAYPSFARGARWCPPRTRAGGVPSPVVPGAGFSRRRCLPLPGGVRAGRSSGGRGRGRGVTTATASAGQASRTRAFRSDVVITSAWRGSTFSMRTRWTSGSGSSVASASTKMR